MKIRKVVSLTEVVGDLNDGRAFYDKRGAGVGDYFWESIITDIESLRIYAGNHTRKYALYYLLAKRFSDVIYHKINDDVVYITAILHMHCDPGWKKK